MKPGADSPALRIWPWLAGLIILGLLGDDGDGALKVLPEDWDALIVAAFALVVRSTVIRTAQPQDAVEKPVEADLLDGPAELRTTPGIG